MRIGAAVLASSLLGMATPAAAGTPFGVGEVPTKRNVIALTFDDGPNPVVDPQILAVLRRHGAHATFFMVGARIIANPAPAIEAAAAGMEIGNHTFSHPRLAGLDTTTVDREIGLGAAAIKNWVLGREPTLFRPPYGEGRFDHGWISRLASQHGEQMIGWRLSFEQALRQNRFDLRASLKTLLRKVRPGSIILAHDGGLYDAATLWLLPRLLTRLAAQGYRVTTVTDLLQTR